MATGCVNRWGDDPTPASASLEEAVIADAFDYRTTSEIALVITAADNQDRPLRGVDLSAYYALDTTRVEIGRIVTTADGRARIDASLPTWVEEVTLSSGFVGIPDEYTVAIQPGENRLTIGGADSQNGRTATPNGQRSLSNARTASFSYLSSYDANGVPDNLLPVDDYVSQDLLDLVNNSLPEQYPVPTYNPQYLRDDLITDVQLQDSAEVWVTFVHEGAGWRNALGYYTYDLATPPSSTDDINELRIIFPNASFTGSGGDMKSGNKVSLGTFSANTGIGWFLVPNAWNGTEVLERPEVKYSNKDFNTFTESTYRQHIVLLKDEIREILLLGIEDTSRPGGDNDFNDAVFYVSANPFAAVITDQLEDTQTSGSDRDSDGVADRNDAYPDDSQRAFNVFAPGSNAYGSVAFEDNWPQRGDYDMNDVVVDYQYQLVTNARNQVVEMIARFTLVAAGASYDNGFGLALPVEASRIRTATLTGTNVTGSEEVLEEDQDRAVFLIFGDAHVALGSDGPVNTVRGKTSMAPANYQLTVVFDEPISTSELGFAPFDPFIYVDQDRTREVHLPNYLPTSKANIQLLGSLADTSDPAVARYYKSATNLPWAIHLPMKFAYPVEYSAINLAHLRFVRWAESGGIQYKDWYLSTSGYRKAEKIYND